MKRVYTASFRGYPATEGIRQKLRFRCGHPLKKRGYPAASVCFFCVSYFGLDFKMLPTKKTLEMLLRWMRIILLFNVVFSEKKRRRYFFEFFF